MVQQAGVAATPLALFTATRWEFNAVCRAVPGLAFGRVNGWRVAQGRRGETDVCIVQTGVGVESARRAALRVLAREPFGAVLSVGFGGALTTAQVGDLLIATEVVCRASPGASIACAPVLYETAVAAAKEADLPAHSGALLTVRSVAVSARHKAELGAIVGAVGLDMESAAVGAVTAEHGIPFLAVRTVSDRVDENLPIAFNDFLRPGGWAAGVLKIVTRPDDWGALARLRRHTSLAAQRLSAFVAGFLDTRR